jgi:4a-hydroxytetrahydrobiopterin dehydratase
MNLADKKCQTCHRGMPALDSATAGALIGQLADWSIQNNQLQKDFHLKDFAAALRFVNQVGAVAETEQHHPDILLHRWNRVHIMLWTHVANGLTENDFILAAKIDRIHP